MEELSLLQQGYYLLGEKNYNAAREIFAQSLTEKEEPGAYLGLLLAAHSLRGEEQLTELPEPLLSYEEYQKALACSDEGGKAMLTETAEKQKAVLEKKKEKYAVLSSADPAAINDPAKADELIALALLLGEYKDAPIKKEELEKRKDELEQAAKKRKKTLLTVLLPICALLLIALIVAGFLFAMPKKGGVRYALWFGEYTAISCDKDATEVVIEDQINGMAVTAVGSEAFKDCKQLKSVTLGANVKKIGEEAFEDCKALESVTCGAALETIGKKAFNDCKVLAYFVGSEGVKVVEESAFKSCKKLRILRFSAECTPDPDAFRGCQKDLEVWLGDRPWEPTEEPVDPTPGKATQPGAPKLLQI